MKDEILKKISAFGQLSESELKKLLENIDVRTFKKRTLLLKEGQVSEECFFVLKGCVRQFHLTDTGKEKTTEFYTENQTVTPFKSYSNKIPSKINLECIEDCILTVSNASKNNEMYEKFPDLESITHKMMEKDFGNLQDDFANFISSSPEQRYFNLLEKRPYLFHRVPNHQIASYLGLTPESLSRIKSRVNKKK